MNTAELKFEMLRNGDKNSDLASALGISESRVSAKVNAWGNAKFTDEEKIIIKNRYSLSEKRFMEIFY